MSRISPASDFSSVSISRSSAPLRGSIKKVMNEGAKYLFFIPDQPFRFPPISAVAASCTNGQLAGARPILPSGKDGLF